MEATDAIDAGFIECMPVECMPVERLSTCRSNA